MAVLINFKICDNDKACGGVAACPTGAIYYDEEKETLAIDNSKCISCGLCEKECPIGAIKVAKDDKEYEILKKQIEDDPRKIRDLFVDRYGAAPLSEFFMLDSEDIEKKTDCKDIVLIEFYNDDSIQCLLKSIPIKELLKDFPDSTQFYKVEITEALTNEYQIKELPALVAFENGRMIGKIEGYVDEDNKEKLMNEIQALKNK